MQFKSRRLNLEWLLARKPALVLAVISIFIASSAAQTIELHNQFLTARFGARGLTAIADTTSGATRHFSADEFSLMVDQMRLESLHLPAAVAQSGPEQVTYSFQTAGYELEVVYRLRPEWRFVSKQIRLTKSPAAQFQVREVEPLRVTLAESIASHFVPQTYLPQFGAAAADAAKAATTKDFGAFLRFQDHAGMMLLVQNPFLHAALTGQKVSISYEPDMAWRAEWGPFESDIACLGLYTLSGERIPARMTLEWQDSAPSSESGADTAEIEAFTASVRQFLLTPSAEPVGVLAAWTLNDYQIDVATEAGREEYRRIIDSTASLGIGNLLYAPSNSALAKVENDADDWNWEHVLWFGLGQQIRRGEWDPATSPVPDSVRQMLAYAREKHIGLLAYVYPSLPFAQNPGWMVKDPSRPQKNTFATLSSREFQDWLVRQLLAFQRRTGIAGYSFDYTYLTLPGSSSYAQWRGWRRVLESLRRALPAIVIDGRQTYQTFGPWTWLAGSYPHPTGNDEQPESFVPFPDLHFDRVSADRLRFVNYWYRNYQFAPQEIIPGYMTHQTERSANVPPDAVTHGHPQNEKFMPTRFRARDWDYLGYRYSVISSIATGGWNHVMNMIPARDSAEFTHFSDQDKAWIRGWLDWVREHKDYLRHTRTILGQPAIGRLDGAAAISGDRGYIFLFNPNYQRLTAEFRLDRSIGLTAGTDFLVRELYPRNNALIGKERSGVWRLSGLVTLPLAGTSAVVLEVMPVKEPIGKPLVFGSAAEGPSGEPLRVQAEGGSVVVEHASGEPGTEQAISILLPEATSVSSLKINGTAASFSQTGRYVTARVKFSGGQFAHSQQISLERAADGSLSGTFVIPQRIPRQLAGRKQKWPIPWTAEDYETTWLVPERLLMYVQIAEPSDSAQVILMLDGKPLPLTPAYSSVRVKPGCFVGLYADVSHLAADTPHTVSLLLPEGVLPHLQGIFFDNVETEYTEAVSPPL